jgi:putative ABC transport system ATP-binding protein
MIESLLSVQQLRKTYRVGAIEVEALRGIDLQINSGEFVSLVGPSGSGKSTFFHIVAGLTPPTSGTVRVAGSNVNTLSDAARTRLRRHNVSLIFQKFNLLPNLSAADNIRLASYLSGSPRAENCDFVRVVDKLGISERLNHKPEQLSGGEQQRVAIARALVNRPKILLADEPTGSLDSRNSEAVLDILRSLNRDLGLTILMITHDADAASYGHRTLFMRDGRINSPGSQEIH